MSGLVKDNIFGSSGIIAEAAGGLSWQPIVTASTVSVEAAKGYFINTTSNACTITLPSSAEAGDQIILVDYARTWGTNAITIDSNGLNFQGESDLYTVDYDTSGQALNLVYSGATVGWTPSSDIVNALEPVAPPTQKGLFGYGQPSSGYSSLSNLISSSGVVASDVTGVGTARSYLAGASYGGDKAIFGFGTTGSNTGVTNLVSNSGVVAADVSAVGTARNEVAAASYGNDKAIFGFGNSGSASNITNLVNSSGVVQSDVSGIGTAKNNPSACGFGGDKAIFAYGTINTSNIVNNSGVVQADVTGVGSNTTYRAAAGYGGDKGVFAYGVGNFPGGGKVSYKNLVSNLGVIAADVTGVGTARGGAAACSYGGDKAIFGYGDNAGRQNVTNLVNNLGVIGTDVTGVGTARTGLSAAGYSASA
jgi:hypothetical protein